MSTLSPSPGTVGFSLFQVYFSAFNVPIVLTSMETQHKTFCLPSSFAIQGWFLLRSSVPSRNYLPYVPPSPPDGDSRSPAPSFSDGRLEPIRRGICNYFPLVKAARGPRIGINRCNRITEILAQRLSLSLLSLKFHTCPLAVIRSRPPSKTTFDG